MAKNDRLLGFCELRMKVKASGYFMGVKDLLVNKTIPIPNDME